MSRVSPLSVSATAIRSNRRVSCTTVPPYESVSADFVARARRLGQVSDNVGQCAVAGGCGVHGNELCDTSVPTK